MQLSSRIHLCTLVSWESPVLFMTCIDANGAVQSSGDFINRYRATLVLYAHVKSHAAFAEAFVRG